MEIDNLNDLSLGEAFRKHVLEHCEVADVGRRLIQQRNSCSDVFLKGQAPGPYVDFHWPLHSTAESIAYQFVSSPVIFLDQPLPTTSELEAEAGRVLADRIGLFIGRFANGEIIAVGTFSGTGVEAPIGAGQWRRKDLLLDVENSALCELRNHRPVPLWTGVSLRLSEKCLSITQSAAPQNLPKDTTKARKQIQTIDSHRLACIAWLKSIMSDPTVITLTNEELWAEAASKWPGTLSEREFARCRRDALTGISEDQRYIWGRPGPKSKRS